MRLVRINVISAGVVLGGLYAVLGLILGSIFSILQITASGTFFGPNPSNLEGTLFGVGAVILLPIFYGIAGFFIGLIMSALYNFVVRFTGGIKLEFE